MKRDLYEPSRRRHTSARRSLTTSWHWSRTCMQESNCVNRSRLVARFWRLPNLSCISFTTVCCPNLAIDCTCALLTPTVSSVTYRVTISSASSATSRTAGSTLQISSLITPCTPTPISGHWGNSNPKQPTCHRSSSADCVLKYTPYRRSAVRRTTTRRRACRNRSSSRT